MTTDSSRRLNAIGFVVADMAATIDFYRRCGLPGPDSPVEQHAEITLDGGFRLMFDTIDVALALNPGYEHASGVARAALAIECPSPADVDAAYADLTAAGAPSHLAPFDAPWGQRYASVLDPDGTQVDFYAALGDSD